MEWDELEQYDDVGALYDDVGSAEAFANPYRTRDELQGDYRRRRYEEQKAQLFYNLQQERRDPDAVAKDLELARRYGAPPAMVSAAREQIDESDRTRNVLEMPDRAPFTAEYFARQDQWAISNDEMPLLEGMEVRIKDAPDFGEQLLRFGAAAGAVPFINGVNTGEGLWALGMRSAQQGLNNLQSAAQYYIGGGEYEPFVRFGPAEGELSPTELRILMRRQVAADLTPQFENPNLAALYSGYSSIPSMLPAIAVGALTRSPKAAAIVAGITTAGDSYMDGIEAGLEVDSALQRAYGMGAVETATSRLPFEMLFGKSQRGKSMTRRFLESMAVEQVEEAVAEEAQAFIDLAFLDRDKSIEDWARAVIDPARRRDVALATLAASGPINATVLAMEKRSLQKFEERMRATLTPEGQTLYDHLRDMSKMKTYDRDRTAAEGFVEDVTKDTPLETTVVDVDGIVNDLQQAGIDPDDYLRKLGLSDQQIEDAKAGVGLEVEVPTGQLFEAARDNLTVLQRNTKTNTPGQSTMSQREAIMVEEIANVVAQLQERAGISGEEKLNAEVIKQTMIENLSRIFTVEAEQKGADISPEQVRESATTWASIITTMAAEANVDPVELYNQIAPTVAGMTLEGQTIFTRDTEADELMEADEWRTKQVDVDGETRNAGDVFDDFMDRKMYAEDFLDCLKGN